MAVDITTTTNNPGAPPDVTEINDNFDLIKTELDAFPQNGALKALSVGATQLQTGIVAFTHMNPTDIDTSITDTATKIPTSSAVVDYLAQPRGVAVGFKELTMSVGTGNVEPSGPKSNEGIAIGKIISVKAEVCFTDQISTVDEQWFDVSHTYRASGTDGGRHFGSSWYKRTDISSISCYCNVFPGGMETAKAYPANTTADKTVRWTVFYKE